MKTNQEKVQEQFLILADQIKEQLEALTKNAENLFNTNPETIHWGHVGNLVELTKNLAEATHWAKM